MSGRHAWRRKIFCNLKGIHRKKLQRHNAQRPDVVLGVARARLCGVGGEDLRRQIGGRAGGLKYKSGERKQAVVITIAESYPMGNVVAAPQSVAVNIT